MTESPPDIQASLDSQKSPANLKVLKSVMPSTPLPTVDEIPTIPEELKERFPEWEKFEDEFTVWYRQLRRFILEQGRLLSENNNEE